MVERVLLLIGWFVVISTVGYMLIALDKLRVQYNNGGQRIPHARFNRLALLGAWPGILVAMHIYHHKTRRSGFQAGLATSVIANLCFVLALLVSPLFDFRMPSALMFEIDLGGTFPGAAWRLTPLGVLVILGILFACLSSVIRRIVSVNNRRRHASPRSQTRRRSSRPRQGAGQRNRRKKN
ncbi:hypothetical protein CL629_03930 [bacterium]|nr:hypothetical protein [bacterium]